MGTASTMNSIAEALGMSLPGSAIIPAPYPERKIVSYQNRKKNCWNGQRKSYPF